MSQIVNWALKDFNLEHQLFLKMNLIEICNITSGYIENSTSNKDQLLISRSILLTAKQPEYAKQSKKVTFAMHTMSCDLY